MFPFEKCLRADMVQMYKIYLLDWIIWANVFFFLKWRLGIGQEVTNQELGNSGYDVRGYFFLYIFIHFVLDFWRSLPEKIASQANLNIKKKPKNT